MFAVQPRVAPETARFYEYVSIEERRGAREAGLRVYFKTNLLGSRILELPFDAPIEPDPTEAPAVFHYLKRAPESANG